MQIVRKSFRFLKIEIVFLDEISIRGAHYEPLILYIKYIVGILDHIHSKYYKIEMI